MADNIRAELCVQTVENAYKGYPDMRGAILHSDRGSQYTSEKYRCAITNLGIIQSMNSVGGRCHDNARCESMWARMKDELFYLRDRRSESFTINAGKSHLMSVISAIATDADNLQYLQNQKCAKQMEPITGKFEVLRIEIGGVVMPLYDVINGYIQDDFDDRGIDFIIPEYERVKSLKTVIRDMMMAFSEKYRV